MVTRRLGVTPYLKLNPNGLYYKYLRNNSKQSDGLTGMTGKVLDRLPNVREEDWKGKLNVLVQIYNFFPQNLGK